MQNTGKYNTRMFIAFHYIFVISIAKAKKQDTINNILSLENLMPFRRIAFWYLCSDKIIKKRRLQLRRGKWRQTNHLKHFFNAGND